MAASLIRLIPGVPIIGFADVFDGAYGDPSLGPYPEVTPSRMGSVLLPFACPKCDFVLTVSTLAKYTDKGRKFSWCPRCQGRLIVKEEGMPLPTSLSAGAIVAPALINGKLLESHEDTGVLEMLGALTQ